MSALRPDQDSTHDLGTTAARWRNLFVDTITITDSFTTGGSFIFEGATADDFETTLGVVDPTADRTINLPNQSGTLPVLAAASTTAITATPEELNLLDASAGVSVALATNDGLIIGDRSDSNATKKVLMSDVITLLESSDGLNAFANRVTISDTTNATTVSDGSLTLSGGLSVAADKDVVLGGDLKLLSDTSILSFGSDGEVKLTHVHNSGLTFEAGGTTDVNHPKFTFKNTTNDAEGPEIVFAKDAADDSAAIGDLVGRLSFQSQKSGGGDNFPHQYGTIETTIKDFVSSRMQGQMDLKVLTGASTSASGITLKGTTGGVVDVDLGYSASSTVTIAGNLRVSGTTTTVDTTNLNVTDKNILVNNGGTTDDSAGAGVNISGDASAVVGFLRAAADNANLEFKAPTGSTLTVDVNADKTLTIGGALNVSADSVINQNLATTSTTAAFETLTLKTSLLPDATGGIPDIGSTTAEFGDIFIGDAKSLKLGADQDVTITHDNDDGLDITAAGSIDLVATADHITAAAGGNLLLDAAGVLELNSSAGAISIGNDDVEQNISIGTGAAARTITVGNVTGATALNLNAGTGGVNLASTGTGDIIINSDDKLLLDSDGDFELNSSAGAVRIGNDPTTGDIDIGQASSNRTVRLGNTFGTSRTLIYGGGNGVSVYTSGDGDIILDSHDTLLLDADGVLELNSSAGAISIGNDDVEQAINIGTGAAARTITVGNVTGATALNLNAGTGGIALASTGAGDITLDSDDTLLLDADGVLELNSSAGAINIGNDAVAQAVNIATGAAARAITIGNAASASLTMEAGVGAASLTADTTVTVDGGGAVEINSSGGAIGIGNDAVAQAINIGTGAAARTITVGNNEGATGLALTSGTGDIALSSTDAVTVSAGGIIDINSSGGAIGIGTDANGQNINVGTGAGRTITIGNNGGATGLVLTSGTGSIALSSTGTGDITLDSDDTLLLDADGVLELNSSAGAISIGNDADEQAINVGTGGAARTITIGNNTGATGLVLTSGTGSIALSSTGTGDITLDSDDTLLLDSDGVLELNSSAGAISIGSDDVDQNINIGTDGERTIQIGTDNGTGSAPSTKVDINAATIELDASTKVLVSTDSFDITSDQANDPLVRIINTNSGADASSRLQFVKDKGAAGADGDDIGIIEFIGDDAGQTQTSFAKILAEVSEADDSDEAGKLSLMVGASDGTNTALVAGLVLEGEHATGGEVDVTIAAGSSSLTTIAGNLTVGGDFTVNGTNTVVNSTTLQIDDKNIELAHSPSGNVGNDASVDGGGITLKSSGSDKTITYVNANTAWEFSENLVLANGKAFSIDNGAGAPVSVLSATTLGGAVVNSSLTSVGILDGGSITSGFGAIDNGTSNITTGGLLKIDIDGTAIGSAGSLTLGAGGDAGLFVTGDAHAAGADHLIIENTTSNKDIFIRGKDGSDSKDILTVDVSAPKVITRGGLTVTDDAALASATKLLEIDPDEASPFHVTAASKITGALTVTGRVTAQDIVVINDSAEDAGSTEATPLTTHATYYNTGAGGETSTLATGTEGQIKVLAMESHGGGNMVVTVSNPAWSGSTVTLSAQGQACTLQYIDSKWYCIGNNGCTFG